jgi:hypothetical protein
MLHGRATQEIPTFAHSIDAWLDMAFETVKQDRPGVHGQRIRLMSQAEGRQRRQRIRRPHNVSESQRGRSERLGETSHDQEIVELVDQRQGRWSAEEVIGLINSEKYPMAAAVGSNLPERVEVEAVFDGLARIGQENDLRILRNL